MDQNTKNFLFTAELSDIKTIYNVLKCIPYQEFAVFRPMEEGLKITVEASKDSEISVYIPVECFTMYKINAEEQISFKFSLKIFAECLNIFKGEGSPSMKISYRQYGSPLYLVIKHSDEPITMDCEFNTVSAGDFSEVNFSDECDENSIIFNGEQFVKILNNLDMLSDDFTLSLSPQHPHFQITTNSYLGVSTLCVPKHSTLVAKFECKSDFKATYNFSNLKQILKVMNLASKISISTGASGLLGISLIINYDERLLYVEYFCMSQFSDGLDD